MQNTGDLEEKSQSVGFHSSISGCADGVKHRQDDVVDEGRMKEPESRAGGDKNGEGPSPEAASESQPPAQPGAFLNGSQSLE